MLSAAARSTHRGVGEVMIYRTITS